MAATLYDPYGRAISSSSLYKTPSQRPNDQRPRSRPRARSFEAVSAYQRRELVDVARVIAAGVPVIDGALTDASEFAISDSWHVKSRSRNKGWGTLRDRWINQFWSRRCNARGEMYDFRTTLKQLIRALKVEGDYGLVFDGRDTTDRQATGQFHVIGFDRIGTGAGMMVSLGNGLQKCHVLGKEDAWMAAYGFSPTSGIYIIDDKASPFDGQRIIDGVIVDGHMRTLGYRILGFNAAGKPAYSDIYRGQMHFNFSGRRYSDQIRGIPELAEATMAVLTLEDYDWLIGMAMKLSAALSVVRESADGNPMRGNRSMVEEEAENEDGTTYTRKTAVEEIFPGIVELATNSKESMKTLEYERPSMNEQEQIRRIETAVLHKLWPRALIYEEKLGRAGARTTALHANAIITHDQTCVERSARWMVDRGTEFSMRRGFIPPNTDGYDPYEYEFRIPGKFTVDEGYDGQMRLASLGRCTISRGIICANDGYMAEDIEAERMAEEDRLMTIAEKLSEKHPDWTAKEILNRLDSGEANVSISTAAPPAPAEDDEGATKDGE
jgi:hypothetical protein